MSMDKDTLVTDAKSRMDKAINVLKDELGKMRTGRASLSILDDIKVDYYGTPTPLNQIATLGTPDARLITVQPWEANMVSPIEKALLKSTLGLTPSNDGKVIRLPIPALTEERRKELVKGMKKHGEDSKIAIRNVRRDANEHLKKLEKEDHVSEDEIKKATADVQKLTDDHTKIIDELISHKEKEIMTV